MQKKSLSKILYQIIGWNLSKCSFFADLILAVIASKNVCLPELAACIESRSLTKSVITRIERFLRCQDLCYALVGKFILSLVSKDQEKLIIAIDRTNWQFGKSDINFFVAAIIIGNMSVPFAWMLLDKKGNSSTSERIELMGLVQLIIPKERIELVVADREFVGENWIKYLVKSLIPFAIRVKKSEQIRHPNGGMVSLEVYFESLKIHTKSSTQTKFYGLDNMYITCMKMEKDSVYLISNRLIGEEALQSYKKRWGIERTFKAVKSSGFNLESTHITDLKKLSKLFAIISMAVAVCIVTGVEIEKKSQLQ